MAWNWNLSAIISPLTGNFDVQLLLHFLFLFCCIFVINLPYEIYCRPFYSVPTILSTFACLSYTYEIHNLFSISFGEGVEKCSFDRYTHITTIIGCRRELNTTESPHRQQTRMPKTYSRYMLSGILNRKLYKYWFRRNRTEPTIGARQYIWIVRVSWISSNNDTYFI